MAIDRNDSDGKLGGVEGGAPPPSNNDGGYPPIPPGEDPGFWQTEKGQLILAIQKLIKEIKTGKPMDHSSEIAKILGQASNISGGVVSDDAKSMTALDKYSAATANMQTAMDSQDGSKVALINQYTGEPEMKDGKPVTGTPEQAIENDAEFIKNNPNEQYKLNTDGSKTKAVNADGSDKKNADGTQAYVKNPSYNFFHANKDANKNLYDSMSGNVDSVLKAIDPDYTSKADPKLSGDDAGKGVTISIKAGAVKAMWDKELHPQGGSDDKPGTPDSTQIQAAQSAVSTLVSSDTNISSAIKAIVSQATTNYQATTSAITSFEKTWLAVSKAAVNGVKAT